MAPRDTFFPPDQLAWISATYPDFEKKLGYLKPLTPGKPLPKDDDDLTAWKTQKFEEFKTQFKDSVAKSNEQDLKSKFFRKYTNRKDKFRNARVIATGGSTVAKDATPFYLLPDAPDVSARELFRQRWATEINQEATERREAQGKDSKSHLGFLQSVIKERWNATTDEVKAEWEAMALEKKAEVSASDGKTVFENQKDFPFAIWKALRAMIGSGRKQVGPGAIFHIMWGFRQESNGLDMASVTVDLSEGETFENWYNDYEGLKESWERYCREKIPLNRRTISASFKRNSEGLLTLPPFDEENGKVSEYRALLTTFLEDTWELAWPADNDMPGLPWADITLNPDHYINRPYLPAGIEFGEPEKLTARKVQDFAANVVHVQSDPATSSIPLFVTKDAICQKPKTKVVVNLPSDSESSNPRPHIAPSPDTISDPTVPSPNSTSEPPETLDSNSTFKHAVSLGLNLRMASGSVLQVPSSPNSMFKPVTLPGSNRTLPSESVIFPSLNAGLKLQSRDIPLAGQSGLNPALNLTRPHGNTPFGSNTYFSALPHPLNSTNQTVTSTPNCSPALSSTPPSTLHSNNSTPLRPDLDIQSRLTTSPDSTTPDHQLPSPNINLRIDRSLTDVQMSGTNSMVDKRLTESGPDLFGSPVSSLSDLDDLAVELQSNSHSKDTTNAHQSSTSSTKRKDISLECRPEPPQKRAKSKAEDASSLGDAAPRRSARLHPPELRSTRGRRGGRRGARRG